MVINGAGWYTPLSEFQTSGFSWKQSEINKSEIELIFSHKKKTIIADSLFLISVIPLGLEPRAHTLKVYCSTN
jgi:hypothetical protein